MQHYFIHDNESYTLITHTNYSYLTSHLSQDKSFQKDASAVGVVEVLSANTTINVAVPDALIGSIFGKQVRLLPPSSSSFSRSVPCSCCFSCSPCLRTRYGPPPPLQRLSISLLWTALSTPISAPLLKPIPLSFSRSLLPVSDSARDHRFLGRPRRRITQVCLFIMHFI